MLGAGMLTYTGVLIGATAIPVWHDNVRLLPVHFAAAGLASPTRDCEEGSGWWAKIIQKVPVQECRKTSWMTWLQADVFIHVKEIDFAPVNTGTAAQRFQKCELGVASRQDHIGVTALVNGLPQESRCI